MSSIEKLIRDMRLHILSVAVAHGMTYADASAELDSLIAGNDGSYTARIRAIMAAEGFGHS